MLGLMKKVIPRTHVREGWKEFMGSVHSPDSASPCITLKLLVVHVHDTYICIYFFFVFFSISWASPVAYGDSQTRGRIGAIAAGLHHSSWQCRIFNPLSETRDRTRILMDTSHVLNLLSHNRNSLFQTLNTSYIFKNSLIEKKVRLYTFHLE